MVDEKWRVESDLRTLREACAIMKDNDRLKKVKKLIGEEEVALKELSKLKGLRRDY
jgi:hypothetical protein